jgi:hypothetical protein
MKSLATTGLLAASMLAIPAPAKADVHIGLGIRIDHGRDRYDGRRIAYDRGYEDGHREGEKDGRRGERFSFWDEGRYRDGDHGYRGGFGPRWEYTSAYRRGFEAGYRRAYDSYFHGRYDRREGYRDRYDGRDGYRRY